jgi:hypothetical protein
LISICQRDGGKLYTGVTGLTEANNWGKGSTCSSLGGTAVGGGSSSSAATASLWKPNASDFPGLQVQVPGVISCRASDPTYETCWSITGGYWIAVAVSTSTSEASVQVMINNAYTDFTAGNSSLAPEGTSLIGDALRVKFGVGETGSKEYPAAMIGFNFKASDTETENITTKGGYCLTYTSTGAVDLELKWVDDRYGYDTWFYTLTASSTAKTVNIPWNSFIKDGYETGVKNQPVLKATDEARGLYIRLRNGENSSAKSADFALFQLGWLNECN